MAVFYSYGLDIGGKNGTILSQIEVTSSSIVLKSIGTIKSLDTIDKIFKENRNNATSCLVIDAPLSYQIEVENGKRQIDQFYQDILNDYEKVKNEHPEKWVVSCHSLMAVPIKGIWAARLAANNNLKVLETHPRVFLYALINKIAREKINLVFDYKNNIYQNKSSRKKSVKKFQKELWEILVAQSNLRVPEDVDISVINDDHIDSLVCALAGVSVILHSSPEKYALNADKSFFKNIKEFKGWTDVQSLIGKAGSVLQYCDDELASVSVLERQIQIKSLKIKTQPG